MILGMASFGHKGVIFPLLVRGIGVLGSIISTYTVKAGPPQAPRTMDVNVAEGDLKPWDLDRLSEFVVDAVPITLPSPAG